MIGIKYFIDLRRLAKDESSLARPYSYTVYGEAFHGIGRGSLASRGTRVSGIMLAGSPRSPASGVAVSRLATKIILFSQTYSLQLSNLHHVAVQAARQLFGHASAQAVAAQKARLSTWKPPRGTPPNFI